MSEGLTSSTAPASTVAPVLVELLEVVTVGLPFCAFKLLFGSVLLSTTASVLGWLFIVLGAADVVVNAVNATGLLLVRRRWLQACTLSLLAQLARGRSRFAFTWQELGTSVDVLLSMAVVALMIGLGFIARLSPPLLLCWNVAVIANVLGAGVARFGHSLHEHLLHRR